MRATSRPRLVLPALLVGCSYQLAAAVDILLEYTSLTMSENQFELHGETDDDCGVCGGNNERCSGCDAVPNSGRVVDVCGICGGDGSTCVQSCNVQVVTETLSWAQDIIWSLDGGGIDADGNALAYGPAEFSDDSTYAHDFDLAEGTHTIYYDDAFGDGWDGSTVAVFETGRDADQPIASVSSTFEQPQGSVAFDVVCGGVRGCDGIPGSGLQLDLCGVCDGDGTSCSVVGQRCSEAAYSVRLSAEPVVPTIVTASVEACVPLSLCSVELFQDSNADFFWQRELYFDRRT
eukprot:SAG31_NODE_448_length_15557_cov_5.101760_5_plen_290_part_00